MGIYDVALFGLDVPVLLLFIVLQLGLLQQNHFVSQTLHFLPFLGSFGAVEPQRLHTVASVLRLFLLLALSVSALVNVITEYLLSIHPLIALVSHLAS